MVLNECLELLRPDYSEISELTERAEIKTNVLNESGSTNAKLCNDGNSPVTQRENVPQVLKFSLKVRALALLRAPIKDHNSTFVLSCWLLTAGTLSNSHSHWVQQYWRPSRCWTISQSHSESISLSMLTISAEKVHKGRPVQRLTQLIDGPRSIFVEDSFPSLCCWDQAQVLKYSLALRWPGVTSSTFWLHVICHHPACASSLGVEVLLIGSGNHNITQEGWSPGDKSTWNFHQNLF